MPSHVESTLKWKKGRKKKKRKKERKREREKEKREKRVESTMRRVKQNSWRERERAGESGRERE